MIQVPRLSRRARWAVPAGVVVITGGVIAGSAITIAQAAPGLPVRTPAQLLVDVADSTTPPLTGTVVETASLGLPSLPGTGNPTSISSLLTGSHTVRVWYSDPRHFRLAVPEQLSESDVIRDGSTAWLWESTKNAVTKFSLPAHPEKSAPTPAETPLTPQQAAQQVLAEAGKSTTVTVETNVTVAGEPAYQLALAPKDPRSLVGQVTIAVDGRNNVPLRVQVFARGASTPAFQVGYTAIQFVAPAASELTFTPPPGSTVTQVSPTAGNAGNKAAGQDTTGVSVIGSDWLTVLDMPSSALNSATSGSSGPASAGTSSGAAGNPVSVNGGSGDAAAVLNALLGSATPARGAWGSGRLLRTSLVSVLITDSGRMYIGAVEPSVLYAAAGR
jgi:outer membrane lipoprotein-sorting protein